MKLLQDPVERLLYISLAVIFLVVLLTGAIIAVQLNNEKSLGMEIKNAVIQLKEDKAARDKIILDHTDCIAYFLSQPNRGTVRLQDIQHCKVGP